MIRVNHFRTRRELWSNDMTIRLNHALIDRNINASVIFKCSSNIPETLSVTNTYTLSVLNLSNEMYHAVTGLGGYTFVGSATTVTESRLFISTDGSRYVALTNDTNRVLEAAVVAAWINHSYGLTINRDVLLSTAPLPDEITENVPTEPETVDVPRHTYQPTGATYNWIPSRDVMLSNIQGLADKVSGIDLTHLKTLVDGAARRITELEQTIAIAYKTFKEAKQAYADAKRKPQEHPYEELASLIKDDYEAGTVLYYHQVEDTHDIAFKLPITFWDESQVDEVLEEASDYDDDVCTVLHNMLVDKSIELICVQGISFTDGGVRSNNNFIGSPYYYHPHVGRYNCFGDNQTAYREEDDWLIKYNIIKNTLGQWNLYDSCVLHEFLAYIDSRRDWKTFKVKGTNRMVSVDDILEGVLNETNTDNE